MNARRIARENRILKLADDIRARRRRDARAEAFALAETVRISWTIPHAVQTRLGLPAGYDGVDIPAARVAPMVRARLRRAP